MVFCNEGADNISFEKKLELIRKADANPPKHDVDLYIEWLVRHYKKENEIVLCLKSTYGFSEKEAKKVLKRHWEEYYSDF